MMREKKTITDWWWKTGSMGRWKPGILKMNENYIDPYVLALWLNMNTDDVYNTLIICGRDWTYHESWFASWSWICSSNELGTGCSFHDLSPRTVFGTPLLDMINHVELWTPLFGLQTPLRPSRWVSSVTTWDANAHTYTRWYSPWVVWMEWNQRNVMQSNQM